MNPIALHYAGITFHTSDRELRRVVRFLRGILTITTNESERKAYQETIEFLEAIYS